MTTFSSKGTEDTLREVMLPSDFIPFRFASVDIMHWFGYLLEDFHQIGAFVNDCIFKMMHHVAGDVGRVNILFQPIILKAFSRISDTGFEMCEVSCRDFLLN